MKLKLLTLSSTLPLILLVIFSGQVLAVTYSISGNSDLSPSSCSTNACPSLRDAVIASNSNSGEDIIQLQEGTYTLDLTNSSSEDENNSATGDLDVKDRLIIEGGNADDPHLTIITADTLQDRIFHVSNSLTSIGNLTLRNLTLRGVELDGKNGGAIFNSLGSTLTLENVVIRDNITTNLGAREAQAVGAGIYNGGNLNLRDSFIINNTANVDQNSEARYGGGGLYNAATGDATITNTTFRRNIAVNNFTGTSTDFSSGGAILNLGTLFIEDSIVGGETERVTEVYDSTEYDVANQSEAGGGISNVGGFMTINKTNISHNTTLNAVDNSDEDGREGGGIYNQNAGENRGSLLITASTLSFNVSTKQGGGLFSTGVPLTIAHSTINDNTATFLGGGVVNIGNQAAEISSSTIAYNTADSGALGNTAKGGGLFTSSRINITNVTIAGNSADEGTQIFIQDNSVLESRTPEPRVSLENTLIDHRPTTQSASQNCEGDSGFIDSLGYNINSGESCNLTESTDIQNGNPELETALAENSAINTDTNELIVPDTLTIAFASDSSIAIDQREGSGCPSLDQRYFIRDSRCDIGAFEHEAAPRTQQIADMKVTLTEKGDPVPTETQQVYTASVINIGPHDASSVTLTFFRPDLAHSIDAISVNGVLNSNACEVISNDNSLLCAIGTVDAFETVNYGFTITYTEFGDTEVSAEVASGGSTSDYFLANNTFTETTEVQDKENCDRDIPGCNPFTSNSSGGGGFFQPLMLISLSLMSLLGFLVRQRRFVI